MTDTDSWYRKSLMDPAHDPHAQPAGADRPALHRLEAESFYVDGLELVVFELQLRPEFPESFTAAERAVAQLLCEGHGIASIAERRGARYRTIANQLASMYRKVGVHSSAELIAQLAGQSGRSSEESGLP